MLNDKPAKYEILFFCFDRVIFKNPFVSRIYTCCFCKKIKVDNLNTYIFKIRKKLKLSKTIFMAFVIKDNKITTFEKESIDTFFIVCLKSISYSIEFLGFLYNALVI